MLILRPYRGHFIHNMSIEQDEPQLGCDWDVLSTRVETSAASFKVLPLFYKDAYQMLVWNAFEGEVPWLSSKAISLPTQGASCLNGVPSPLKRLSA